MSWFRVLQITLIFSKDLKLSLTEYHLMLIKVKDWVASKKKHQPSNSPYWHLETSDMHQPWRPSLDYFFSLSLISLSLPNLLILAFWFFSFGLQRSVEFWIMMKGMSRAQGCAIRIEVNNDYCLFKWLLVWKTSMPKIRRVNTCGLQRFNERLRYRFLRWKSSPLTLCYTLV